MRYCESRPDQVVRLVEINGRFRPPISDDLKIVYTFSLTDPPICTEDENGKELTQSEIDQQIEKYKQGGEWGPWLSVAIQAKGLAIDQRHIGTYTYVGFFDKVLDDKIAISVECLQASINEAIDEHCRKRAGVAV